MSDAFRCDMCFQFFQGEAVNILYFTRKMLKKEYCSHCWRQLIDAVGSNVEEDLKKLQVRDAT